MSSSARALLLLNPASGQGRARRRYRRVRGDLASRFDLAEIEMDSAGAWEERVERAAEAGVRIFVAAGGDGTVNALACALVSRRGKIPLPEITLGAVGLGSSNDFHKPPCALVRGVPVRLQTRAAAPRDIARATYEDDRGVPRERIFLVSASLGVTATANALFNGGGRVWRFLKRRCVNMAILSVAVRAILRHRGIHAVLRLPESTEEVEISSLSLLKTPHLSGSLLYDTPVDPSSGLLAVNLCHGMSRLQLLSTLAGLRRGRFLGRPGTRHWMTNRITVELERAADLELDGEVFRARRVTFDVLPEKLSVCA